MNEPVMVLEEVSLVAPLGVRFWDAVTNSFVADGLDVEAYPAANPTVRTKGLANASSVVCFPSLPSLDPVGAGDDEYWGGARRREYVVEVTDMVGRFQPFFFRATLPVRGLFQLNCLPVDSHPGSPLSADVAGVPLFSTAARRAPAGTAVVRADLVNGYTGEAAAWAVLEVRLSGQLLARGLADERGSIAILFHYPEPRGLTDGSPPSTIRTPLMEQTWPIDVRAFYSPSVSVPDIPELCAALNAPPATLWQRVAPPLQLQTTTLAFGRDLILRSGTESSLVISPGG